MKNEELSLKELAERLSELELKYKNMLVLTEKIDLKVEEFLNKDYTVKENNNVVTPVKPEPTTTTTKKSNKVFDFFVKDFEKSPEIYDFLEGKNAKEKYKYGLKNDKEKLIKLIKSRYNN